MLQKGQLVLPNFPPLPRQMAGLQIRQGERGLVNYRSGAIGYAGRHCDSLYLATLPHRPPRAHRYVCHLAHLAGSTRVSDDARVRELACPTVETGAGLKVPKVPTLQSVAGEAWTAGDAPARAPRAEGFRSRTIFHQDNKEE